MSLRITALIAFIVAAFVLAFTMVMSHSALSTSNNTNDNKNNKQRKLHRFLGWNKITCDRKALQTAQHSNKFDLDFVLAIPNSASHHEEVKRRIGELKTGVNDVPHHRKKLDIIRDVITPSDAVIEQLRSDLGLPKDKCTRSQHTSDTLECRGLDFDFVASKLLVDEGKLKKQHGLEFCLYAKENNSKSNNTNKQQQRIFLNLVDDSLPATASYSAWPRMPRASDIVVAASRRPSSSSFYIRGLHPFSLHKPKRSSRAAPKMPTQTSKPNTVKKTSVRDMSSNNNHNNNSKNEVVKADSYPSPRPNGIPQLVEAYQHFNITERRYRFRTFAVALNCFTGNRSVDVFDWCGFSNSSEPPATAYSNVTGIAEIPSFIRLYSKPVDSSNSGTGNMNSKSFDSEPLNFSSNCFRAADIAWNNTSIEDNVVCYVHFFDLSKSWVDHVPMFFGASAAFYSSSNDSYVFSPVGWASPFHSGQDQLDADNASPIKQQIIEGGGFMPDEIRSLYNVPAMPTAASNIINDTVRAAISTAVVEFVISDADGGFDPIDVLTFMNFTTQDQMEQVGFNYTRDVVVTGPNNKTAAGETALDIELVIGTLPSLRAVVLTVAGDDEFADQIAWVCWSIINGTGHWTTKHGVHPTTWSVSWGASELWYYHDRAGVDRVESLLAWLQFSGVTFVSSTGDEGSFNSLDYFPEAPSLGFPANSPSCVGAGAITPVADAASGNIIGNLPTSALALNGITSGGGVSDFVQAPRWQTDYWQFKGRTNTPYFGPANVNVSVTQGNLTQYRGIPDIATLGSKLFTVVDGQFSTMAGTSASSPILAAIISRINLELYLRGKQSPIPFASAFFYHAATVATATKVPFRDVTSGDNCATEGSGSSWMNFETLYQRGCFGAREGWDAASGLGAPDFAVLLDLAIDWVDAKPWSTTTTSTTTTTTATIMTTTVTTKQAAISPTTTSSSGTSGNSNDNNSNSTKSGGSAGLDIAIAASCVGVGILILAGVILYRSGRCGGSGGNGQQQNQAADSVQDATRYRQASDLDMEQREAHFA